HLQAIHGAGHGGEIGDVGANKFGVRGAISGQVPGVDLRRQIVEDAHTVAAGEKSISQVRADEAGPASDQDVLSHRAWLPGRRFCATKSLRRGSLAGCWNRQQTSRAPRRLSNPDTSRVPAWL